LKLLAGLFVLMLAAGAVSLWLWRRSPEPEPCESRTVARSRSPDDRSEAEIFELKCSKSLTTHVALRPSMAPSRSRSDVLVIEGSAPVGATWISPKELSIEVPPARVLVTETRWRDVTVKLRGQLP
jgi:hypothetical protein